MIRSALRKLLWMARATSTVVGLAIMLALVVGVATAGLGATGGNFILGKANSAGAVSKLTASIANPALQLVNQSTASGATALGLNVASGKPPLKVNATAGKATNLNADKLDGLTSARLAGTGDSAYRGGASVCGAGGAPFTSTLPVSVSKQSLLFATARAGVQANGNANASTLMNVELRNAENTTTLASTGFSSQAFSANSTDVRDLLSEGVLKSGISSPSEAPFVLQPGVNYVLRMTVSLNGGTCTGSSPAIWSSSLSYIQLGTP
jgi:hypothetical protein